MSEQKLGGVGQLFYNFDFIFERLFEYRKSYVNMMDILSIKMIKNYLQYYNENPNENFIRI